jgi:NADH-quinone oxidoreductase subunit J
VKAVGEVLFTDYLFPFEIVSILIVAAIVGAVVLSKKKSR